LNSELEGTGLTFEEDILPAIRTVLQRGLGREFLKTCLRVKGLKKLSGGMKSILVGQLTLDLGTVIKLEKSGLKDHHQLMSSVNKIYPRTFVEVAEELYKLDDGRHLLLMAEQRKYDTLLEKVYRRPSRAWQIERQIDKTIGLLMNIWKAGEKLQGKFDENPFKIKDRIVTLLVPTIMADPELAPMLHQEGSVNGFPCAPVSELLEEVENWYSTQAKDFPLRLAHGDLHFGNVFARRYGNGYSVRAIDPNPTIGFTDPLYDIGKLLHWAEPVGWTRVNPGGCSVDWKLCGKKWTLHAAIEGKRIRAAEKRRGWAQTHILARLPSLANYLGPGWRERLPLAVASAHLGLAALSCEESISNTRRTALA